MLPYCLHCLIALIQGHQLLKICTDFCGFSGVPGTSGLAFLSHSFNLPLQLLLFLTFAKIRKRTIGGLTWFGHVWPCKVCLKDEHFPQTNHGHTSQIAQTSNTLNDHKWSNISCSSFSQHWSPGKIFRAESSWLRFSCFTQLQWRHAFWTRRGLFAGTRHEFVAAILWPCTNMDSMQSMQWSEVQNMYQPAGSRSVDSSKQN